MENNETNNTEENTEKEMIEKPQEETKVEQTQQSSSEAETKVEQDQEDSNETTEEDPEENNDKETSVEESQDTEEPVTEETTEEVETQEENTETPDVEEEAPAEEAKDTEEQVTEETTEEPITEKPVAEAKEEPAEDDDENVFDTKEQVKHYGGPLAKNSTPLPEEEVFVEEKKEEVKEEVKKDSNEEEEKPTTHIFALRTTANREDQVMDFLASNIKKRKLNVYSVIRPHGMRGYIFLEAEKRIDAEQAGFNIPYARGVLKNEIGYNEIEHMLEQVKKDVNIKKNDIAEIIAGPFKREKCKIMRIDKAKEEVVVELLDAAVPIPITLKIDALKVIRRDTDEDPEKEE
ncbi:transcription elongation factor Spt5 [Candidatus Woesearchaeota archaeon]|jgi:transcription termination/antitermination protein NusG|nr:transcription elongation factor Spt5 [Candidatus Woesearchaeota archaeon]